MRVEDRRVRAGCICAETLGFERRTGAEFAELKLALDDRRHAKPRAHLAERRHQGADVDLRPDGQESGDHGAGIDKPD